MGQGSRGRVLWGLALSSLDPVSAALARPGLGPCLYSPRPFPFHPVQSISCSRAPKAGGSYSPQPPRSTSDFYFPSISLSIPARYSCPRAVATPFDRFFLERVSVSLAPLPLPRPRSHLPNFCFRPPGGCEKTALASAGRQNNGISADSLAMGR